MSQINEPTGNPHSSGGVDPTFGFFLHRSLRRVLVGLLLSMVGALNVNAQELKKVALIIGNGAYRSVQQLTNPTHDAELMATTLAGLGFSVVGNQAQENLTLQQFTTLLNQFSTDAQTADVAFVYYAGHGIQLRGVNYLVPIDAKPTSVSDLDNQMVDAGKVLDTLDKSNIKLKIMVLDACRNNPFAAQTRGLISASRGLADMSRGLTAMSAPAGTVIWYATQPGNVAVDGVGNNGPFALAISHSIVVPGLDIFAVFNKTGLEVMNVTNSAQTPWIAASVLQGIFYFKSADGPSRSVFVPASTGESPSARVRSIFSSGIKTPTRSFEFGQTPDQVNQRLDTPFALGPYNSLPRATEYGATDVRYFWTPTSSLPVVLSTLVTATEMSGHCIDPQSYVAFFFKDQKLFHISIRLFKGQTCSSYGWLFDDVLSPGHRSALIHSDEGDTSVVAHDETQFSIIEITQQDTGNIWTD